MATLTNAEVLEAQAALQSLAQERLPFGTAMMVRRLVREVSALADDVRAEERKIADPFLKRDENGGLVTEQGAGGQEVYPFAGPEAQRGYFEERAFLMAVTVECSTTIRADALGLGEVRPAVLIGLGPLLKEGE